MDGDVAEVDAGGVADREIPDDRDGILVKREIDILGGRANDLDGVHELSPISFWARAPIG